MAQALRPAGRRPAREESQRQRLESPGVGRVRPRLHRQEAGRVGRDLSGAAVGAPRLARRRGGEQHTHLL